MTVPFLDNPFNFQNSKPFALAIETIGLFTFMFWLLFKAEMPYVLLLQGIDLMVIPLTALFLAFRTPGFTGKDSLFKEALFCLGVGCVFVLLRCLLNIWAYQDFQTSFPFGPHPELSKMLIFGPLSIVFFRVGYLATQVWKLHKRFGLGVEMAIHYTFYSFAFFLSVIVVLAFCYAMSSTMVPFFPTEPSFYQEAILRFVLGFLSTWAVGFGLAIIFSPFVFLAFTVASSGFSRGLTSRLAKLEAAFSLPLAPAPAGFSSQKSDFFTTLEHRLSEQKNLWQQHIEKAQTQHQQMAQAFKEQQTLLATLSHELKTPILLASQQLAKVETSLANKVEVNDLKQQFEHVHSLLSDVLDLSKSNLKKLPLTMKAYPVDRLVSNVVNQWKTFAWERFRVQLSYQIEGVTSPATIDPTRTTQIISNLIHNGLRFSQPGGMVLVRLRQNEQQHILSVYDTGAGIPEEQLPHIWKPFFCGNHPHGESSGIGLTLVHELSKAMGFKIQVESCLGQGTAFHITITRGDHDNLATIH